MNRWLVLSLALCAWGGLSAWSDRPMDRPDGVLAPGEPLQTPLSEVPRLVRPGYRIEALVRFEVEARVLGREIYRLDRGADLVPVDLALGWGPMSDSAILRTIDITQSSRFYYWRTAHAPIPREAIAGHSANMHLIPSDAATDRRLRGVRVGEVVHLQGYLVQIMAIDGWRWRSSLTRTDTGNGACELIWVESVSVR